MIIRTGMNLNFRVITQEGDELATIEGHKTITEDLKEIYENCPCPWSFVEWVDTIYLEPWLSMESMSVSDDSTPTVYQDIWQR